MAHIRDPLDGVQLDGRRIRALRLAARLRQEDVAKTAGITAYWLRCIELHGQQPSRPIAEDIAAALSVPLSDICRDTTDQAAVDSGTPGAAA